MKESPPVVLSNPFADLDLPVIEPRPVQFLEPDEAGKLYAAADELGDRWRVLVELGMRTGLRTGELFGLHGHLDAMTRQDLRQWPKSNRSHRVVPVPAPDAGRARQGAGIAEAAIRRFAIGIGGEQ